MSHDLIPLDCKPRPDFCDCEFTPDPEDPDESTAETSWHFLRECALCKTQWFSLHCPHDGCQNPCPTCGITPFPIKESE